MFQVCQLPPTDYKNAKRIYHVLTNHVYFDWTAPYGRGSDNVTKAFVEIVAILLLLLLPGRPRKYKTNPPTATNHVLRLDRSLTVTARIT